MRLLHTSDWHLGRSFHREGLLDAQAAFVDHLVEVVRTERVDLVLVCGDVYDRALPPVDAVGLCGEALARLRDAGARVVLVSGNHDSPPRLGFGAELMERSGVHLRCELARVGQPVLCDDEHGPVAVHAIPYVEPDVARVLWGTGERGHHAALRAAMERVHTDLRARPHRTRSVVLAHAFVTGGQPSDSERDISVGGVAQVPVEVFGGVDYVALGHLHGRAVLTDAVRYSGSPLAYSFSEEHHRKGSWIVELGPSGLDGAWFVDAPVPRRVARIAGRLDDLLTAARWREYEQCWLQVTLTDPRRPREAMDRLRARFPHTLVLGFAPQGAEPDGGQDWAARVRHGDDSAVLLDFVADVRGEPADTEEAALLRTALEHARRAGEG